MSLPEPIQDILEQFIARAQRPAVLDAGEEPLPLTVDRWSISEWNGRTVLQVWDGNRNLVRKIVGIKDQRRSRLTLITERFPKASGELQIVDLAGPESRELERRTTRIAFRDRFRLMLAREFPQWRVEDISTDPNLEQSLSPSYTRAFLRNGSRGLAAVAAPPNALDVDGVITGGLIWLDYLRGREKQFSIPGLLVYVPRERHGTAAARITLLDPQAVVCRLYVYDERGRAGEIDLNDAGNLASTLPPCRRPLIPNEQTPSFPDWPEVEKVEQSDGAISFRVRGFEFARWRAGRFSSCIGRRQSCAIDTVETIARELARIRCTEAEDRQHPFYAQSPEGWLEAQVRADPAKIDASLVPTPIYGQVPVFSGRDRGIVDLLGVDHTGRLVVMELKAAADLHLPFQALDYWIRVRKHLEAGDFERLGYFPGISIRPEPPRIILVAPAFEFHSTTEAVLSYLKPEIEIMRVGLAGDWRSELRVMFRLRGYERP